MCSQYLGIRDTEYPRYQIYGWLRIESNRITDYSNETIGSWLPLRIRISASLPPLQLLLLFPRTECVEWYWYTLLILVWLHAHPSPQTHILYLLYKNIQWPKKTKDVVKSFRYITLNLFTITLYSLSCIINCQGF